MDNIPTQQVVAIIGHMLDRKIPLLSHQMKFTIPVAEEGRIPEMVEVSATVVFALGGVADVLDSAAGQIASHIQANDPSYERVQGGSGGDQAN
jgi:hypothetical protein